MSTRPTDEVDEAFQSPRAADGQNNIEDDLATKPQVFFEGLLRKKGLILHNERIVRLDENGKLTYFKLDRSDRAKGAINLKHSSVEEIRFVYAGRPVPQHHHAGNKD